MVGGDTSVLELRIHGINNTPPVAMLGVVARQSGNEDVGFYATRPNQGATGVKVMAFSWGALARSSPFGGALRVVGRMAWIAVLPFGIVNLAYWSRRLTMPGMAYGRARFGAATVRVFALGLTLLFVSSICSVTLDMFDGRLRRDGRVPQWLSLFQGWAPGERMALFSLLPVAAVLGLWWLSTVTRTRYDHGRDLPESTSATTTDARFADPQAWKFATRAFWDNAGASGHNAAVHAAAGIALISVWTGQHWIPQHEAAGRLVIGVAAAVVLICIVLIAAMPLVTEAREVGSAEKLLARLALSVSGVLFVGQAIALVVVASEPSNRGLVGLSAIPAVITGILLIIALSALGWRCPAHRRASVAVAVLLGLVGTGYAVVLVHEPWRSRIAGWVLLGVLAVIIVGWLWHIYGTRSRTAEQEREAELFRGTAPGVFLVLGLFAAMLLSTVFVMAAAGVLGGDGFQISSDEWLAAPPIYLGFASLLLPAIMVIGVVFAYVGLRSSRGAPILEPDLDELSQPSEQRIAELEKHSPRLRRHRQRQRRRAALGHRGEPLAAAVALIAACALTFGLGVTVQGYTGGLDSWEPELRVLRTLGVMLAAIIGAVIAATAARERGRPLGIVWDLICFLPRAAHPFGPPCYAQRAIPSLFDFCRAWLEDNEEDPKQERRLVLSAHSLGGVLAVPVLLMLATSHRGRVALLTHGSQLRRYCSRMFPELLGPAVLGVTPSRAASLTRSPVFADDTSVQPACGEIPSLREVLATGTDARWLNLWRPTDHLGFPAYSRMPGDNPIDRLADEATAEVAAMDVDERTGSFRPTTFVHIGDHADYWRTAQYQTAVEDLTARFVRTALPTSAP